MHSGSKARLKNRMFTCCMLMQNATQDLWSPLEPDLVQSILFNLDILMRIILLQLTLKTRPQIVVPVFMVATLV